MELIHRDELTRGGFAGLREHRLIMDPRVFGRHANPGTLAGLGNLVYLADARFLPKGETQLHPHREIDVISVMVEGRIHHEGSLEHGGELKTDSVQVQRAGGEGFRHNEVNPDPEENRMIQLWILPEQAGEPAGYRLYQLNQGGSTRVYGGPVGQTATFAASTVMELALLGAGQRLSLAGSFLAYLTRGSGRLNGKAVRDGHLVRDRDLVFEAEAPVQMIVVHLKEEGSVLVQ